MRLVEELLTEILRDAHRYAPGVEPDRPTFNRTSPTLGRRLAGARQRARNLVERAAARAGFARSHLDPEIAAAALSRILALGEGLEKTADLLADEPSRRALIAVLKLRVLGPYHSPLQVTPDRFRAMQIQVDRTMMREPATFEVADPWFSPLSRYEVPLGRDGRVSLHAHSVDVVSVFLLDEYSYRSGSADVAAQHGHVVLDVGGCWGDTALYFASLVGPAGKVYTFECDPNNLEIMRANLALNPELAARIEVVEKAVWHRSGERLSFAPSGRTTAPQPGGERTGLTAETITLDDFVAGAGLTAVDFVKMDVEGAEAKVLDGARQSLARYAPLLAAACYHRDDDLVLLPETIADLDRGYRCFVKTSSPLEEETVLFAAASSRNST